MSEEQKGNTIQFEGPELPPPGDERREVLRERQDTLEEAAQQIADDRGIGAIDPNAFKIDRELAQKFDVGRMSMLTVTNPQPGWEYAWANFVNQAGLQVIAKKALGWIVVSGADPECIEHKGTDGTRRVGDVLLLKIPEAKKRQLDQRDAELRRLREASTASELEELGHKYRDKGLKVHTPQTGTSPLAFTNQQVTADPRRQAVAKQAGDMLGDMVRQEIPGVPIPGKEG